MHKSLITHKSEIQIIKEFVQNSNHHSSFTRKYHIQINDDGTIYDLDQKKTFTSLNEWAKFITQ